MLEVVDIPDGPFGIRDTDTNRFFAWAYTHRDVAEKVRDKIQRNWETDAADYDYCFGSAPTMLYEHEYIGGKI